MFSEEFYVFLKDDKCKFTLRSKALAARLTLVVMDLGSNVVFLLWTANSYKLMWAGDMQGC